MAESWRAKATRYLRRDFTKRELEGMVAALVADQVIDVATGGRLNALKKTALKRAVVPLMRVGGTAAGRTGLGIARTGLAVGKQIALRHPVLTGGAVVYYAYKNREELGDLVEQGYEVIQEGLPSIPRPGADIRPRAPVPDFPFTMPPILATRRKSKFNQAIKVGMATVKNSTSFGKKGTINNAKKAFTTVTKTVSAAKKGRKKPKTGIRKKIYNAIRRYI